jgi:hypothetical protein
MDLMTHPHPSFGLPGRFAALILGLTSCTGGTYTLDAGASGSGYAFADIGTVCKCETETDPVTGGLRCIQNPTNTCTKSGMTCVLATPEAAFSNAGNPLWEAPLFYRAEMQDGGFPVFEGECTLTASVTQALLCPLGTVALALSSGLQVCKRTCLGDSDCGRDAWVCDQPRLDQAGIDSLSPAQEIPSAVRLCRPACSADFPDCNRSTTCTIGKAGCQRSAFTRNAPTTLGIYIGDRNGARVCNGVTGHCEDIASRGSGYVGDRCTGHADCQAQFLCVSDTAYADVTDGYGFCTYADCNPSAAANTAGACVAGLTCEYAFEMGMCFPDCQGGTLCSGQGQKCAVPDMGRIANYDSTTGAQGTWKQVQCVDCDTTGVCP